MYVWSANDLKKDAFFVQFSKVVVTSGPKQEQLYTGKHMGKQDSVCVIWGNMLIHLTTVCLLFPPPLTLQIREGEEHAWGEVRLG